MSRIQADGDAQAVLAALTPAAGARAPRLAPDALARATGLKRDVVAAALGRLVDQGAVVWLGHGRYRLAPAAPKAAPPSSSRPPARAAVRPSTLRDRFWRAMRNAQKASVAEVVRLALKEGEDARLTRKAAATYLRALERAGYLIRLTPPGDRAPRYSLIRNTGPEAPAVSTDGHRVTDRNTGDVHALKEAAAP